jgi:hypothetical protein
MLFNSAPYLLFLPACVLLYWLMPRAWRLHFLVVASYLFYATWSVPYAAMMFGLVVVNWGAAVLALRSSVGRNAIIGAAIVFDLAVLALFKYLDFFADSATGLLRSLGQQVTVRAPFDLIHLRVHPLPGRHAPWRRTVAELQPVPRLFGLLPDADRRPDQAVPGFPTADQGD